MSLFRSGGSNYMPVADIEAAASWYIQKLGLQRLRIEMDDCDACVALGFERDDCAVVVGPQGKSSGETAMLFTSKVKKAREFLLSRGVQAGEIQHDAQGTSYFEMHDLEGNVIEISEEP